MTPTLHKGLRVVVCDARTPVALLATLALAHPWMEATMPRHMGLQLPLLFLLGWWAAHCAGKRLTQALASWNAHGANGLLAALCITSFWMLPAALDHAVLHAGVALAKVVSLVLAGLLAGLSWPAASQVLRAFFAINGFWMMLAAGLLYQEAPQQLCSVYLSDQQGAAGRSLVAWSVVGMVAWLAQLCRYLFAQEASESRERSWLDASCAPPHDACLHSIKHDH